MLELVVSLVLAGLLFGVIYVMTQHSIIVVNRKDPAMATIKERLAALEAAAANAPQPVDTSSFASADSVTAVADRVTAIEAEIGTDPAPAPVADPAPSDPAAQ